MVVLIAGVPGVEGPSKHRQLVALLLVANTLSDTGVIVGLQSDGKKSKKEQQTDISPLKLPIVVDGAKQHPTGVMLQATVGSSVSIKGRDAPPGCIDPVGDGSPQLVDVVAPAIDGALLNLYTELVSQCVSN